MTIVSIPKVWITLAHLALKAKNSKSFQRFFELNGVDLSISTFSRGAVNFVNST